MYTFLISMVHATLFDSSNYIYVGTLHTAVSNATLAVTILSRNASTRFISARFEIRASYLLGDPNYYSSV